MRSLATVSHGSCQVTIFNWNQKYLLKVEIPGFEQTYKLPETDYTEEEIKELVANEAFIADTISLFKQMAETVQKHLPEY